jgi:acetyl-CoA acetyltransferase
LGSTIVAGVGQTDFSWHSGRAEVTLASEAIAAALEDAGLAWSDVDGMVRYAIESTAPTELVERLGIAPLRFAAEDGNGGGSTCGILGLADAAIRTGRARVVVAYRAFNARSQLRLGHAPPNVVVTDGPRTRAIGPSPPGEFGGPYGLLAPAHIFALWARAYMHRFAVDETRMERALAAIVSSQRRWAERNPHALLREKPLTAEEASREAILAEPLRRSDLCLESDGACAVVLCARDRADDCRSRPVRLLGATQAIVGGYHNMFLTRSELPPRPPAGVVTALLAEHGATLADVDVVGTYDASSANVVFDIESLGLCAPGEGVDWAQDPSVPVNTSGGLLAEVYLQGMNHVVELVRQLRGTAPVQVEGAELALAAGPAVTSAALLGAAA